jgi:hypothetical protein
MGKVGAVPLSQSCLSSPKVQRSVGDDYDNQQALVYAIVEQNVIACNALLLVGYNSNVMKIMLTPVEHTNVITTPHSQDRIKLLSQVKIHGNIFAATGGVHLTANDIFQGNVLKQCMILREKLAKEKMVH